MAEEAEGRGVAGDLPAALDKGGGALLHRLAQVGVPLETMDREVKAPAGANVLGDGGPHREAGQGGGQRLALHQAERLAHVEAELGVERQRTVVVGGLHQAHAGEPVDARALEHGLHQAPSDRAVLRFRIDGDRADAGDRQGSPEEVAADDAAIELGDDGVRPVPAEQVGQQALRRLHRGKVGREAVLLRDGLEAVVADRAAGRRVLRVPGAHRQTSGSLGHEFHPAG